MKRRYVAIFLGCLLARAGLCATETRTLQHDGRTRSYLIHVPESYDVNEATSLVLALHGYGNTGAIHEQYSGLSLVAGREGFIVVYPNALPFGADNRQMWNAGGAYEGWWGGQVDDVGFLSDLIDTISEEYAVDPNCVFVFGNSNGGFMAYHLAARLPFKIAAIACCSGLVAPNDFIGGPPVSVVHFHGDRDDSVPYDGIPSDGYPGVEEGIALWVERNGCNPVPVVLRDDSNVLVREWSAPGGVGDIVLYKMKGRGHTLPTGADLSAPQISWAFFMDHPKKDPNQCFDEDGPVQNLTTEQRFSSIQCAIEYADPNDEIVINPGVYIENIDLTGKQLILRSSEPNSLSAAESAVIEGVAELPVITIASRSNVRLQGLTICNGSMGIHCSAAQLQLSECIITGNAYHGVELDDESELVMRNCIVADNSAAGLRSLAVNVAREGLVYSEVDIANCTIVQNQQYAVHGNGIAIKNSIIYFNGYLVRGAQINGYNIDVTFSNVQGGFDGDGNIDVDPLFIDMGNGDYHLQTGSPCIDAGDPNDPVGSEPLENGGIINMGAYGGTAQASRTTINGSSDNQ